MRRRVSPASAAAGAQVAFRRRADLVRDEIGADHVVFGSDWPHAECGPEPADYASNELGGRSAEEIRKIMSDNLFGLMGLKQPA